MLKPSYWKIEALNASQIDVSRQMDLLRCSDTCYDWEKRTDIRRQTHSYNDVRWMLSHERLQILPTKAECYHVRLLVHSLLYALAVF